MGRVAATGVPLTRRRFLAAAALACLAMAGCAATSGSGEDEASDENQSSDEGASGEGDETGGEGDAADVPEDALMAQRELHDILSSDPDSVAVIDVRSKSDYSSVYIPESKNIPAGKQAEIRIDEFPKDTTIVLADFEMESAGEVRRMLIDAGYDESLVKVLDGGVSEWSALGYETATTSTRKC